jgi:ElaB/YqjD/DUF883 family membrane-anchored ribosome-binding protein
MASATVENAAQTAHQAVDNAKESASAKVDRLSHTAHRAVDRAAEAASSAVEQAQQVQTKVTEAACASIRARPIATVAGALVAGYLLGRLARW